MKDKYGNEVQLTGRYDTDVFGRPMAEVSYTAEAETETESVLLRLMGYPVRKAGDIVKKFVYGSDVQD